MEPFKKDKMIFGVIALAIMTYFVFVLFIQTSFNEVKYDTNSGYTIPSKRLVLFANPPKGKLSQLNTILQHIEEFPFSEKNKEYYHYYKETFYFNRFFSNIDISERERSITAVIKEKENNSDSLIMFYSYSRIYETEKISIEYNGKCGLSYFPFGYPKGSNKHWFFTKYIKKNVGKEFDLFPAIENGKVIYIDSLCSGLRFPMELLDPKNKGKWSLIHRE